MAMNQQALLITTNKQNTIYKYNVVERGGRIQSLGKTLRGKGEEPNVTPDDLDFDTLEGSILKIKSNGDYIPSGEKTEYLPGKTSRLQSAIKIADNLDIIYIYMFDEAINTWTFYSIKNNSWDLVSSYLKDRRFDPSKIQAPRFS